VYGHISLIKMERLSDNDIHHILDHYGQARLQVMQAQHLEDAANFTDPLLVHFQPRQLEPAEALESETSSYPAQENFQKDAVYEDSFSSPGFMCTNWHQLFDIDGYLEVVKEKALQGRLGHSPYRGICWKLFWECLPEDRSQWIGATKRLRADYEDVRKKHLTDPYQSSMTDLAVNNPLSQEEDSPWHQYFQDGDLRNTIFQDVERLYPEMDFFRKNEIDDMILRCLFVYAKEHPNIVYKQGMHEIIAPIVYVLWENAQNVKDTKEDLQEIIYVMNDQSYVEHDAYCIFKEIMDSMEPLFVANKTQTDAENIGRQKVADVDNLFVPSSAVQSTTAISKKLTRIQNYMLKRYDHELYSRLQDLDIAPQVYGIRWIRLLFGREYPLPSLLYLWDAMFADGRSSDLVDFIFIAMLINIRSFLLNNDYSACLMKLMKYPASTDVKMMLRKALSLRSSKPAAARPKNQIRAPYKKTMDRNELLRRNLSESLTEQQKFAHALGSGRQQSTVQTTKTKSSQWYAHDADDQTGVNSAGVPKKEEFIQEVKRTQKSSFNYETKTTPIRSDSRKTDKSSRTPLMKSNVVSQISNAIGKHTSGLSNDVLAKFSSRTRNRPKEDMVSQLEEDHERLQKQISQLQTEYDCIQSLCLFCAGKMHSYLGFIDMAKSEVPAESDVIKSCVSGLQKVRDILARTTDVRPTTDSYERQFAVVDKSLSEAFGDSASKQSDRDEALSLLHDEYHFADRESGNIRAIKRTDSNEVESSDVHLEGKNASGPWIESNGPNSDFNYIGYEATYDQEVMSSNNSESNLSGDTSTSTPTPPEPWSTLKPTESVGDFEKELLLIKDRYESSNEKKKDSGTDLEKMSKEDGDSKSGIEGDDKLNESSDPLSSIEQHFGNI